MGSAMAKPNTEIRQQNGQRNGITYAAGRMQGWPKYDEDRYSVFESIEAPDVLQLNQAFFSAVYDGHAGAKIADIVQEKFLAKIIATARANPNPTGDESADAGKVIQAWLKKSYLDMDAEMKPLFDDVEQPEQSGATSVVAIITDSQIVFANTGDSRAVLSGKDSTITFQTTDHKPELPEERRRVYDAGGVVINKRVNAMLAVSRAFGDFGYKWNEELAAEQQAVTADPEVTIRARNSDEDDILLIGSDGIYDVYTNEHLLEYIRHQLAIRKSLQEVCDDVLNACLARAARDNMTAIIVLFTDMAARYSEEAAKRDDELTDFLREKVKEVFEKEENSEKLQTAPALLHHLAAKKFENMPPGVGIFGKRFIVEELYYEVTGRERPKEREDTDDDTDDNDNESEDDADAKSDEGVGNGSIKEKADSSSSEPSEKEEVDCGQKSTGDGDSVQSSEM